MHSVVVIIEGARWYLTSQGECSAPPILVIALIAAQIGLAVAALARHSE